MRRLGHIAIIGARFGAWRYEIANRDHCFLQGAELAGRLTRSEPEPTFSSRG
jgi:hypothetical protein